MTRTVMSSAPCLRSVRGAFSRDRYVPSGRISSTGTVNDAPIRHSSSAPVAAASCHSSQQAKFRSARHTIPSPSLPISCLARVFSPVLYLPQTAAASARVPHSASATNRTCGNAPRSRLPSAVLVDGPPNRYQFPSSSWTSSVVPSSDTSPSPRHHAPAAPGGATNPGPGRFLHGLLLDEVASTV